MILDLDGTKVDVCEPPDEEAAKVWKTFERLSDWIPANVNKAQFVTSVATEARVWWGAAQAQAAKKSGTVNKASLTTAVFNAAVVGLMPSPKLGLCHFVPVMNGKRCNCELWTGYKGYIALARDSGVIETVTPEVVWRDEEFDRWNDENGAHFLHKPALDRPEQLEMKDIVGAYCITKTPKGLTDFEFVSGNELRGLARRGNVWKSHPAAMAKKTPIRRMASRWPQTDRLANVMILDRHIEEDAEQKALASFGVADGKPDDFEAPEWMASLSAHLANAGSSADVDVIEKAFADGKSKGERELIVASCREFKELVPE